MFRVCHETDSFKIDNARADARQIPPVTGHVMEGYSAERTLAQRVLSNENPPNTFQGGITHKNIILSDFMFSDNSPTSCLNPTVSMVEAVKRLSLGGFSLTQVSGPDGVRYFGQSPDGTSIDLNGRDNQRAVTVVLNGGTPMHFASVAQDGYDSAGNPLVTGTMVVSPGDVPFKYSVLGHTVE